MPAAGYGVPTRFWGEDWVGICGLRISVWVFWPVPTDYALTNPVPRSSRKKKMPLMQPEAVWNPWILDGQCVNVSRTNDNVSESWGKNLQST
jgi:hypothetical protein